MSVVNFMNTPEVTWKEFTIAISGGTVIKIRGIEYFVEDEDELLYAAGSEPLDIQTGNTKYGGSLKMLKGALDDLQVAAKAAGAGVLTKIRFTATITYLPAGSRVLMTDTLANCKISKWNKKWDQGAKFMEIDCPILFTSLTTSP